MQGGTKMVTDKELEIMKELQKPFPPEEIEWRIQRVVSQTKALVLAYVTNRAIQNRLDKVFGVFGWTNEFREWRGKGTVCKISVLWESKWISKEDGAEETNIEATKGGLSGSMKRAASTGFGIGRYLYKLPEAWVDIKQSGENYIHTKIKSNGKDVNVKGYWDNPQLPAWALPEGYTNKGTGSGQSNPTGNRPNQPSKPQNTPLNGSTNKDNGNSQGSLGPTADFCSSCHLPIEKEVVDYSLRKFGEKLCRQCQNNRKRGNQGGVR